MATIVNPFARGNMPSASKGTKQRDSLGSDLSKLILSGAKVAGQAMDIKAAENKEEARVEKARLVEERRVEKARLVEERRVASLSEKNRNAEKKLNKDNDNIYNIEFTNNYNAKWNAYRQENPNYTSVDKRAFDEEFAKLPASNPDLLKTKVGVAKRDKLTIAQDSKSTDLEIKEKKVIATNHYNASVPTITSMNDITSTISNQSDLGNTITIDKILTDRMKYASAELKKDIATGDIDTNTTMKKLAEQYIGDLSTEIKNDTYTDSFYSEIRAYLSADLTKRNKETRNQVAEHINNGEIKLAQDYLKTNENGSDSTVILQQRNILKAISSTSNANDKSAVNDAIKLFKISNNINTNSPLELIDSSISKVNSKESIKQFTALHTNIGNTFGNSDEGQAKQIQLVNDYASQVETANQVKNFTMGSNIPETFKTNSKAIIKKQALELFDNSLASKDISQTISAINTLGKIPDLYIANFKDDIAMGGKEAETAISTMLLTVNGIKETEGSESAYRKATKDPLVASMMRSSEYFISPNGTVNISKVQTVLSNPEAIETKTTEILKSLGRDSSLSKYPYSTRERVARELAYDSLFGLEGKKDLKGKFKDRVKESQYSFGNNKVLDTKGVYEEDGLESYVELFREFNNNVDEDTELSIIVSESGTAVIYGQSKNGGGYVQLSSIQDPDHLKKMVIASSVMKKEKEEEEAWTKEINEGIDKHIERSMYESGAGVHTLATGEVVRQKDVMTKEEARKIWAAVSRDDKKATGFSGYSDRKTLTEKFMWILGDR